MSQYPVTISGNLAAEPQFRHFTESNSNLCKLYIASSRRARVKVDKSTNTSGYGELNNDTEETWEWSDVDTLFINAECWGDLAVNAAVSLKKGMPVIATGSLVTETWMEDDPAHPGGSKTKERSQIKLRVDKLGFELSRHQLASRKVANQAHTPEGMEAPGGVTAEQLANTMNQADSQVDTHADAQAAHERAGAEEAEHVQAPF